MHVSCDIFLCNALNTGFLSDLPWSLRSTILYALLIKCSADLTLLVSVTLVIRLVNSTNFKSSSMVKFLQTLWYFVLLIFRGQMYVTVYLFFTTPYLYMV